LNDLNINTYLPVFALNRSADFTDARVHLLFGNILTAKLLIKIFTIIGYTLGALLLVFSITYVAYVCYKRKHQTVEERSLSIDIMGEDGLSLVPERRI